MISPAEFFDFAAKTATLVAASSAAYWGWRNFRLQRKSKEIEILQKEIDKIRDEFVKFMGFAHNKLFLILSKKDDDFVHEKELEYDGEMFKIYTFLLMTLDKSNKINEEALNALQSIIDARNREEISPGLVMLHGHNVIGRFRQSLINIVQKS